MATAAKFVQPIPRGGDVIIIIIIIIIRRRNGANTICLPNFVWGT
jgi:hypothetical protein